MSGAAAPAAARPVWLRLANGAVGLLDAVIHCIGQPQR